MHKTSLYEWHAAQGARMVEFGGWSMPVQYTSIVEEHRAVRERVGIFDIGHMGRLVFQGPGAKDWLERVVTNQVDRLAVRQIQYGLLANETGGIIDDVLVYRLSAHYLMVCNASNREKAIVAVLREKNDLAGTLEDRTFETAMIAVQGPKALETLQPLFDSSVRTVPYYHLAAGSLLGSIDAVVSRTGYTGEDGFELIVDRALAERVWLALLESGKRFDIRPCGLGARDTLRFEAAMPLYGHELDETVNPFEAGLGWAVKLNKGFFVGRDALARLKQNPGRARIGLELAGKRIARQGCVVRRGASEIGRVTSGTFSPTLGKSLAMALVQPRIHELGTELTVLIRDREEPARIVALPFYKRGS